MSFTKRILKRLKHFYYHGGLTGIACHYLNPQRLQGGAYRFRRGTPERERRLKWVSRYDKVYSRATKVLLGVNVIVCAICIKISMTLRG